MKKPWADFRRLTFAFGLALATVGTAHAFNAHAPFDISADVIDYTDANEAITAEGHVVVIQTTSTLTADWMMYDRVHNVLKARGHVVMHDKGSVFLGDTLDYDLVLQNGAVSESMALAGPWRLQAESWEKKYDYYFGRDVAFTSCDLVDPHYHMRSSRVHVVPDSIFWAWNTKVYVDQLPIFYTPFLYKYLGPRRVVVQVEPGNDTVNGAFAKTTTTMRFTPNVYDKVLFDHYSIAGNGFGNELDYQSTGTIKGSLFGYYINPRTNPDLTGSPTDPQYNIRSYHWEKLSKTMILQSNVNLRNNVSFNNQYFPEDTNQAVTDLDNSIALTQQTKKYTQRLVVESDNAPDAVDTSSFAPTHVQSASLPRYEFTLYDHPIWTHSTAVSSGPLAGLGAPSRIGPLRMSMNANAGEDYLRTDDRTRTRALAAATFSDSMQLSRKWIFTPTVTPQVNWQDRFDPVAPVIPPAVSTATTIPSGLYRGEQSRMETEDTLRYRATRTLTFDQTYSLTCRMAPNGVGLDRSLTDGGVETNHVGSLMFWRPSLQVLLRSFSGYDLRKIADEDPNVYQQRRIDPWTTELTLDPRHKPIEVFGRYQAGWYPTHVSLWETDFRYKGPYNFRLETGLLYNNGVVGLLTWNNTIGAYLSRGWRVDFTVHSLVPAGATSNERSSIIDDEFIVTRNLHCWQAQFVYRNIAPFTKEYSLLFNLRVGATADKPITDTDLESQFYPWRANTYAR